MLDIGLGLREVGLVASAAARASASCRVMLLNDWVSDAISSREAAAARR
jgi:hypothetical protein